MVVGMYISPP